MADAGRRRDRTLAWLITLCVFCTPRAEASDPSPGIEASPSNEQAQSDTGAPSNEGDAGLGRGFQWGLAPVRWGGNLASELRTQTASDQSRWKQQLEMVNLRATSYIWQPWFAQVGGSLGLIQAQTHASGDSAGPAIGGASSSVTGGGNVSLLPSSRFPFSALAEVSDSRASGELTATQYRNERFGLRQSYRPAEGTGNYTASYDRSTLTSSSFGRDTVDVFNGSASRQWGEHNFNLDGTHSRNVRGTNGDGATLNRINVRDAYRPGEAMSVDTLASLNSTDLRASAGGSTIDNRSRFAQLNSFATWRPDDEVPLYLAGGLRVFQADINGDTAAQSRTLSGNVAANYQVNRHTNVNANAVVTQTSSASANTVFTSQGAGVSYLPDAIPLSSLLYRWNAAGSFTNQSGGSDGNRQRTSGQAGHSVSRSFAVGAASDLTATLGQSYSSLYDTAASASQTLVHNAGLAWRTSPSANSTAFASLTAADSHTTGNNANHFQLLNAQANGQMQFSRNGFGAANLTLQATRQSSPFASSDRFSTTTGGNVNYQNLRAFNVPQLRYYANYSVNENQFRSRLLGDVTATHDVITESLEQRLEYRIGRLEMRLSLRMAKIDGRSNSLLFFRIGREFGDF